MPKKIGKPNRYQKLSRQEKKISSVMVSWRIGTGTRLPRENARALVLNPPICPYCKVVVPWRELSLDHKIPRSRGGSDSPGNVVWCDIGCNLMKGNLTDGEFTMLLEFLEDHPIMLKLLRTRLKMSGFGFNRRGG